MNKKKELQFSLDYLNILENDIDTMIVELYLLHEGLNRNMCDISHESVLASMNSFYNKPIIYKLNNSMVSGWSTDVVEHNRDEDDTTMLIAGVIPTASPIEFVEKDDKIYVKVVGCIHKLYQPALVNIINNREGEMKVSIEIRVLEGEQDPDTGILKIDKFNLMGVCLLGKDIMEGIEGSHMTVTKFSLDDYNDKFLSFSKKEYKFKIPQEVKDFAKEGLEQRTLKGRGGTSSGLNMASYLVNNSYINQDRLDQISEFVFNHIKATNLEKNLWGGKASEKWLLEIKNKGDGKVIQGLSVRELENNMWSKLSDYTYNCGDWENKKYYIEEIYVEEKYIIVIDNEDGKYYKISYIISESDIELDMSSKVAVKRGYAEINNTINNAIIFAKEDYGTGDAIRVDKSKKSMSDASWGSVNKTQLRKRVLDASNYKTLVKDVYALVEEGWEDSPSSKLKYPIMEIKGDKAVYNRYGLASALSYAKAENEEEVIKKIESLYKKLEIDEEEGGENKMAEKKNTCEEEIVNAEDDKLEIDNKVDEGNKDVEKIKDDVESDEDDEKEKIEKKNKIDEHDEGEKGLEDDEDADKDYWKKKYESLEKAMAEEKAAKEKEIAVKNMISKIEEFAHCMSEDDKEGLKNALETESIDEVECRLNKKIAEFALSVKEAKEEKVEFSVNSYFMPEFKAGEERKGIDEIANDDSVDICVK